MIEITVTEEIQRPVGQVFAFAGDYQNDPHWRKGVTAMTYETDTPCAVGSRTRETMESMGRKVTTVAEVTAFSPARTAFRSLSGPVSCNGYRDFVATERGTRFTYSLTLYPRGLLHLLEPLLRPMFVRQVRADVGRLKALVEAVE